jgi:2-deoxystreptamine N-acetyl-D-glucosaminyltransferase/2-deoxystreptamine glucosyltransferase
VARRPRRVRAAVDRERRGAGETALVVPAGDSAALAAAIDRLLADPGLRDRLAAAARAFVAPRFGLDTMLDRMEAVFRRTLEDASR